MKTKNKAQNIKKTKGMSKNDSNMTLSQTPIYIYVIAFPCSMLLK